MEQFFGCTHVQRNRPDCLICSPFALKKSSQIDEAPWCYRWMDGWIVLDISGWGEV